MKVRKINKELKKNENRVILFHFGIGIEENTGINKQSNHKLSLLHGRKRTINSKTV